MPMPCPRRRRCRFCQELFLPSPRLTTRQVACSKSDCQKARHAANQAAWLKQHPGYFSRRAVKTKQWLDRHPGYRAEHRKLHPEYAAADNAGRKERRRLARAACAGIQDSIRLQAPVLKRFRSYLKPPPPAGIQDSIWPEVVRLSIFSARFGAKLRRRYTRLDRAAKAVALPSSP
jgi:hypothetical protein